MIITLYFSLDTLSMLPTMWISSQAMGFARHCTALHKVQIDYSARLANHTQPSWWLLTGPFPFRFCLCLSSNELLSFQRLCCMIHGDGDKWLSVLWHRRTFSQVAKQASSRPATSVAHKSRTQTNVHENECSLPQPVYHTVIFFLQEFLFQVGSSRPWLCGLEIDPCNLNDFRRAVCGACSVLSFPSFQHAP